jgi:hypothetical protein
MQRKLFLAHRQNLVRQENEGDPGPAFGARHLAWMVKPPLPGSAIRWAWTSASLCQSWNGRLRQPQSLAPLDGLPQTLSTALLSAEEAKGRLREIVEGFFFRRNSEEGQREAAPVWWTVVGLGDYGSACIISS